MTFANGSRVIGYALEDSAPVSNGMHAVTIECGISSFDVGLFRSFLNEREAEWRSKGWLVDAGASRATLVRRASYGGRKGRRAARRLER